MQFLVQWYCDAERGPTVNEQKQSKTEMSDLSNFFPPAQHLCAGKSAHTDTVIVMQFLYSSGPQALCATVNQMWWLSCGPSTGGGKQETNSVSKDKNCVQMVQFLHYALKKIIMWNLKVHNAHILYILLFTNSCHTVYSHQHSCGGNNPTYTGMQRFLNYSVYNGMWRLSVWVWVMYCLRWFRKTLATIQKPLNEN